MLLLVVAAGVALGLRGTRSPSGNSVGGGTCAGASEANGLVVGSFSNTGAGSRLESFVDERSAIPGLRVRRAFAPDLPTSIQDTDAAGDAAAGIVTFLSVKPSYTDVGSDNDRIAALARSMPAGSYLTAWHEPENDMTAAQYVAMFRNFYSVAKAANPDIYVGNAYMTFAWAEGRRVPRPGAWWVGGRFTDFLATDTYTNNGQRDPSGDPLPMSADPAQLRWHAWAAGKGKPLLITESGIAQGFTDAQRAAYFLANETWLRANGYRMLLFWNGAGTPPNGQNWDFYGGRRAWPKTVAAVSAIACRGRADSRL